MFGLLPIANWIPGGHEAPWYGLVSTDWLSGGAIAFGMAAVLWIVQRRLDRWPTGLAARVGAAAERRPRVTAVALFAGSLLLYLGIAAGIFGFKPLLIDEIVQVMQARIFASGALTLPVAPQPEFFSAQHVVDLADKYYSQFPPGGPLLHMPGVWLGAPWVIVPLLSALSVALWWLLLRRIERPAVALGGALLFGAAPFTAFMAGSHMNHAMTLAVLLIAMWALRHAMDGDDAPAGWALVTGLALGVAASIRPVDAAAFAVPAAIWFLARALRQRARVPALFAAGVGVAIPFAGILAYNAATTGDPLLFGYELLWGRDHGLGFHHAPYGTPHSPARGLELISLYMLRLQTYLFETPVPSLLAAAVALVITPAVRGFDRYLLWASVLLVVAYFAYWHDGFYLGPRFMYALLPALTLWTVRLPGLVAARLPRLAGADRFVLLTYLGSALVALAVSVPLRARQYAGGLTSLRFDYTAPATTQGVTNALILVRESWGSQLFARMWAVGVPRSATESLYRVTDACLLEQELTTLERRGVRGEEATRALVLLARDSARVVVTDKSPDRSERMLPGLTYPPVCEQRIAEDWGGYTFLAPLLAQDPASNVYAREMHARDTLLFARHAGKPVFVLRASSSKVGAPLALYPFDRDSARAEWGRHEGLQ